MAFNRKSRVCGRARKMKCDEKTWENVKKDVKKPRPLFLVEIEKTIRIYVVLMLESKCSYISWC